jgi:hypothetical protein
MQLQIFKGVLIMADAGVAIQKAIYTALNGNIGSGVGVYNFTPQNTPYPYVVISGSEIISDDYFTERKTECFFYISVWSQEKGNKQVMDIISAIDTALHRKKLSLEFGAMIDCIVKRKSNNLDADGVTYMGNLTIHIMVEY